MTRPYKRGGMCSHCDEPRKPGRAYCATHWRQYQRIWAALKRRQLKRLLGMAKNVSIETMDDAKPFAAVTVGDASTS